MSKHKDKKAVTPFRREEYITPPRVLWRRKVSEGVVNPLAVVDRYVLLELGDHLYAFNAVDGALADDTEFHIRMRNCHLYYSSFSGLDPRDVRGMFMGPQETSALSANHVYDLSDGSRVMQKSGGTAGVPLMTDTRIYYSFVDNAGETSVIAHDLKERHTLWEQRLIGYQAILKFPPATDGELLFIRSYSYLHALSMRDGALVWSTKLTGKEKEEGYRDIVYFSAPVFYDGAVYLFRDEYIIPYHVRTGETNYNSWRRYLGSIGLSAMEAGPSPILKRGRIYTAGALYYISGHLAALGGSDMAGGDGYSRVCAFDLEMKRTIWEVDAGDTSVSHIALGGKYLLAVDYEGKVICFSTVNGAILWGGTLDGGVRVRPVFFFGRVYVATDTGWLYCLAL
ncbi:MAG: PQQ-binding-like beta-propeller repeat protein [Deltaproteobacteria bacterium]|nr:PQQ-binding-like beta-propeller repeat protein [Candidatus Zymogenaceae bacterium]